MAMSGATPKHLYEIGLLDELIEDEEQVRERKKERVKEKKPNTSLQRMSRRV